jgi:hypothetical protein
MATNRSFAAMINDYLTIDLLRTELKRMYLLDKVKKDNSWIGGNGTQGFVVPFISGAASSLCFGSLTAANDISEDVPVRATLTVQPELWGAMIFNAKDFMQHDGKKRELSLMKSIKTTIEPFMTYMKSGLSDVLVGGPHFATVTGVVNAATGNLQFDRIEKFTIGQKVIIREAATPAAVVGYVMTINKSTKNVLFNTTRAGGAATDYTALGAGVLVGDKVYYDGLVNTGTGALQNQFTSIRSSLLSAANGGSATLYGLTKTNHPFLQALNIDGSTFTSANILEELFRVYVEEIDMICKPIGEKKANNYWLSPLNYAKCMIILEKYKGQYYTVPGKKDASVYAWQSITIGNGAGSEITLSKVPELANDIIPCINWDTFLLASNGYFRFNENPNEPGKIHYYEVRATTGYTYIIDTCFMGDLLNICPESNAIIYGVSL